MDPMAYLNNGLAIVILIAIGVGITYLARAGMCGIKHLFREVVIPLKNAAIDHLQKTSSTLESVQETNREVCTRLVDIDGDVKKIKQQVCEGN